MKQVKIKAVPPFQQLQRENIPGHRRSSPSYLGSFKQSTITAIKRQTQSGRSTSITQSRWVNRIVVWDGANDPGKQCSRFCNVILKKSYDRVQNWSYGIVTDPQLTHTLKSAENCWENRGENQQGGRSRTILIRKNEF